ncbi:hypothetical protein [Sphingomonas sp. KR3-1]|uniref:hypothetical protein n=1 Tax=Sphingomonas sp. KR3-1 TaxID=3156611 RepID=UPI0032B3CCA0
MKKRILGAIGVAALVAGIARAEVVEITGEFAAPSREASLLRSISIDRIGGQDGSALARAIEQSLSGTHFDLMGGGRGNAEGSLSGGITTGVDESPFKKREKKCVEKNDKGKCVKEEDVELRCRRRIVTLKADLRILRNRDGRIVYSATKPFSQDTSWCEGQGGRPAPVEDVIADGVRTLGAQVRSDIAPTVSTYRVRVRESDKGMSKDQAKRFKDAIKLTKRDVRGACAGWDALAHELPGNPSISFDLGLCAEQRGDYAKALDFYHAAQRAGAQEGGEGADRAIRLIAGREDAAIRARRR